MRPYLPCQKIQRKRKRPLRPPVRVRKLQPITGVRQHIAVASVWDHCEKKTFFVFASRQWSFPDIVAALGLQSQNHAHLMTLFAQDGAAGLAVGWEHPEQIQFEKSIYGWHYWLQHLWLQKADVATLRLVYHNFLNASRGSVAHTLKHMDHHTYLDGFLLLLLSLAVRGELEMIVCYDIIHKLQQNLSLSQLQTLMGMIVQQLSVMQQKGALHIVHSVLSILCPGLKVSTALPE
jgi:hypothetical protein